MIAVVDKKVVKHLVDAGGALLELPVRVSFQYELDGGEFVARSMKRKVLYNQQAALRRLPRKTGPELDEEVDRTVDQMLVEHLRYSGQLTGSVELYPLADDEDVEREDDERKDDPPKIILP